jgi:hypothetical protein
MFWMIYTLYIDSLIFVRKNLFVVFPFFFYGIGSFLLGVGLSKDSFIYSLFNILLLIVYLCVIEAYGIAAVYKREMLFDSEETIWQIVNRFFGKILLLSFTEGFIFIFLFVVYTILFRDINSVLEKLLLVFVGFFFGIAYLISLRHLILHDPTLVMDSMKAGVKSLYKNFFFYLFVILLGGLLMRFPSALFPVGWTIMPFLPIAEFNSGIVYGGGINWFNLMLSPIIMVVSSIAFTYAFLSKNRKEKHAS